MGMLKERDRSMKLIRLPRDSIFAAGQHAQRTAHDGQNGILDVAKVVVDGTHHVGTVVPAMRALRAQLLVELVELLLAGFLVGEDLDHLLAVDHFLDVAVQCAQRLLLADKVFGGLARHASW